MRYLYILLFIIVSVRLNGQEAISDCEVVKCNDTLYIVSHGERFVIEKESIIVKPKSSAKKIPNTIKRISKSKSGKYLVEVPKNKDVVEYIKELKNTGIFESVDFKSRCNVYFDPNDNKKSYQNSYLNKIKAYDVWDFCTGNPTIKVAIIDTGINRDHEDIGYGDDGYSNVSYSLGYDYIEHTSYHVPADSHGTGVAGVLGAKTHNGIGMAGISGGKNCQGVTMVSYRLVNDTGTGATELYDEAIRQAVDDGARVINLSIGHAENSDINSALYYAETHGVTVVCAAGYTTDTEVPYPASNPYTIAVGSIDNYSMATYLGSGLDLVAPGNVYTTNCVTSKYWHTTGTSFSAPQVAGTVALMLSVNPSLTPAMIRHILRNTATKVSGYSYDSNGWNGAVGYGVLNTFAAVFGAMNLTIEGPRLISTTGSYSISNLPNGVNVLWSLSDPYYNAHNLGMTSYPLTTGCYISRSDDQDMVDATLTARIRYNNTTIRTLTKTGLYAYEGFKGHYTSGNLSDNIDYTYYFNIRPNATTYIQSPNFLGATVSYSTTAAIPTIWGHNSSDGDLTFVSTSTTTPVVINVTDMCGNHYTLYAAPQSSYNMNVLSSESGISVMLNEEESLKGLSIDHSWTVEVINAETGRVMATQSSMNRSETISTAGWPKGIYIVKVTIGKEELTEKVIVNK